MARLSNFKQNVKALFGGTLVHRSRDQWGELMVFDERARRTLTFGTIFEQSSMDLKNPALLVHDYAKAMMLVMAWTEPRRVTVLGVGGGGMIRAIAHLSPTTQIDAVELRPEVARIARDWFGLPEADTFNLQTVDAGHFLQQAPDGSSDVILADLYHAHGMSPVQTTPDFLDHCHRVLTDHGWLAINLYGSPSEVDPVVRRMQELFAEVFICPVQGGNDIYFASKLEQAEPAHQRYSDMQALEQRLNVRLDLLFRRLSRVRR